MKNDENMKLNWKFQGVGGSKPKNLPWGNNMNLVFKCEATENVLLPVACFFIIPGKRNVKSTSSDEKFPDVTFVFINKK